MRKWLILLSAFLGTAASGAPAWTWTDANGTVHFSDRPVPGARQVELTGAQGMQGTVLQGPRSSVSRAGTATPGRTVQYQAAIVSPTDQETLRNIGGTLNVQVSVQPSLEPGHRYDLVLDGQRRNVNTTSLSVALPDVFRGTHSLQVIVIDSAGAELMRSATTTFFVQQTSAQNPNSAIARPRPGGN